MRTATRRTDWLTRVLARAGALPQDEAERAVRAGRVRLNGRVVREPLAEVRPTDTVTLEGRTVPLVPDTVVLLFHKPSGCITTRKDAKGRPTVYSLLMPQLPPALQGYTWHAVGRLDADTTGALLFTNDEQLLAHATSPHTRLPKRYLARVSGKLSEEQLIPLRQGVQLGDAERAAPARARVRGPHEVEVTLTEGRFHQVKRMLGAVGLPVLALHREAVGGVEVGELAPGAFRMLHAAELQAGLRFPAP